MLYRSRVSYSVDSREVIYERKVWIGFGECDNYFILSEVELSCGFTTTRRSIEAVGLVTGWV